MDGFIYTFFQITLLFAGNILVGATGFFPSIFMTALNIKLLGLQTGAILTLGGEIFGALLGFHLYRFGFAKAKTAWMNHRFWTFWQKQSNTRVFFGVIAMRLIPFVPSGVVTAGAALTKVNAKLFMAASTIGKIPAVFLELAAVYGFIQLVPASYHFMSFAVILVIMACLWIKSRNSTGKSFGK